MNLIDKPMSIEQYHDHDSLGGGDIVALSKSVQAYKIKKLFRTKATKAMDFGTAFHAKILEPHVYDELVVEVKDDLSFATKEGKAFKAKACELRNSKEEDLIFLKKDDIKRMQAMSVNVLRLQDLLGFNPFEQEGATEYPHFFHYNGIPGKCLSDKLINSTQWIIDVKTTSKDLDSRSLERYAYDMSWPTIAAWYKANIDHNLSWNSTYCFAVFQSVPPFSFRFIVVPNELIEFGSKEITKAAINYRIYLNDLANEKPYSDDPNSGLLELKLADWMLAAQQ